MATETPRDQPNRADVERLGQTWDDILARSGDRAANPADEFLFSATIDQLHARDDIPALDNALRAKMWRDATTIAGIAQTVPLAPSAAVGPNGHHAVAVVPAHHELTALPARSQVAPSLTDPMAVTAPAPRTVDGLPEHPVSRREPTSWTTALTPRLSAAVRALAIGAVAGMVAGAVGGGVFGRIVMRIVALMAEPWQQGMATENGNAVGDITFGGSLELLVFTSLVGIAGGIGYVLVRPWLPGAGLVRGAVFGAVLLLASGWLVMNPDNPDYRRFGSPGVNVALFSLVYLVFGLVVAPVADRLERGIPAGWPVRSRRVPVLAGSAMLILLAAPAILMLAGFAASPSGLLISALLLGTRALVPRWAGRFERPADLLTRPRLAVAAYAAVGVPALIGAVFTLRAIGEILGSG